MNHPISSATPRRSSSRLDLAVAAIERDLRSAGGVVRSRTLAVQGHSAYDVRAAVERRVVLRVRKGWIALPDADPLLVGAARAGVVLTCVTQARRLGLWVLEAEGALHVGAPRHSGGVAVTSARVHWGAPPVPRHPDALVDPIENVLWAVAQCRPEHQALAIWESSLRRGLVSLEALRRLPRPPTARRLCEQATPWSDSGLESFVPPRLRWLGLPIVAQVWIRGHRVDFLIGDRLVLQIDGGHHVGAQREEDIRHDAELALLGYQVVRVGYFQVVERWHEVQNVIMRAVAQGLHQIR
jgi:very-short-patch-repair endonuclease